MQVTNFTQLIDWTRQLHQQLAQVLTRGGELHSQERARMLLKSLAEQEQELANTLHEFDQQTKTEALDAYVPYLYSAFEQRPINTQQVYTQPFDRLSIAEISKMMFEVHDQVVDFYQRLAQESQVPEAKELVDSLLELEQEAEKQIASKIQGMEDM
ncbi:ferritin family protein [Oceanisphaera avium]|uniref:ATPase n=1 Tax=Oceanisphaera avium TaxID=1903694 RepID=A0A1Y0CWP6_9GAMM|nr:hypothetical protein [Oceanisphaera avium]ART79770.1 hypothetical protein CBP12_06055 [Oceanisphaera avium]